MFITLLCIMFSKSLTFIGLTLQVLFEFYLRHPFLFMMALSNTVQPFIKINSK